MRAVLLASALVIALSASGCNTAKRLLAEVMKKGDETVTSEPPPAEATAAVPSEPAPTETAAAVPTDPPPAVTVEAANLADVTRFDDEKKLEGTLEERTTELPAEVELRRAPENGELVAKLVEGGKVERLTERGDHLLVLTADPAQADRKLLGWLPKSALETPAPEPTADAPTPSAPSAVAPVPSAPKTVPSAPKTVPSAPKTTPKPPPTTPPKASTPKPVTPPTPPKSTAPDESSPKKKKKKKKGETLD